MFFGNRWNCRIHYLSLIMDDYKTLCQRIESQRSVDDCRMRAIRSIKIRLRNNSRDVMSVDGDTHTNEISGN
jgi:hypothetical protein